MRRPGLRGCTGAFIALGVALGVMAFPRSTAQRPAGHGVDGWMARTFHPEPAPPAAARPKPPERPRIEASFKPVPVASLDRVLERKMPNAEPEDRMRLAEAILEEARHAAVDPFFVIALIGVESGFDHDAESHRGARGLMQMLPSTLASEVERSEIEGELDDPVTHVRAGVRYYRRLLRAFGTHDVALMAYNAGPNRILKYLKQGAPIPSSIQAYARKVGTEFSRMRPPRAPKPEKPPKSSTPPSAAGSAVAATSGITAPGSAPQ